MSAKHRYYGKAKNIASSYRFMRGRLTQREREEKAAVEKALHWIEQEPDGAAKAKLVEAMYCKGWTMAKAAMYAGYSYPDGASRVHRQFIYKVAEYLGYK